MTTTKLPTRFTDGRQLAQLPWFELREGNRLAADPAIGQVIDMHAHLAMGFVLPLQVDLERQTGACDHYLPLERELDLEVYVNKNFNEKDLKTLRRDLTLKSLTGSGMRATHTIPNLTREMKELQIATSVLLPIDFPLISKNARTYLGAVKGRTELVSFGSVHPYAWDVEGELDHQVALGARGIKVHPAVQLVPPEHPRAMRLYKGCAARKLPVLFHCGPVGIELEKGRELTQVKRYIPPIDQYQDVTFVLGHSGGLQMGEALELAKHSENVWLEISSQSLSCIRKILDEAPADRIVFGTDWPFYHQSIQLAKVLIATEGREDLRRKVFYENAARLLGLGPVR